MLYYLVPYNLWARRCDNTEIWLLIDHLDVHLYNLKKKSWGDRERGILAFTKNWYMTKNVLWS